MEPPLPVDGPARAGVVGGTLLVVALHLTREELLETLVLAAVGALVSFAVSWLLKGAVEWWRSKEKR